MRNWSEINNVLNSQSISRENQQLVRDFLSSFSFKKRQQLMGIFLGFPEKISFFIDLMKKKIDLAKNPIESLATDILDLENREVDNLIKELE